MSVKIKRISLLIVGLSLGLMTSAAVAQVTVATIVPQGQLEAQVGLPYTIIFQAVGGTAPYQWAADLPSWLDYYPKDSNGFCASVNCISQNPDKIQISGIPETAGQFTISLAALDQQGQSTSAQFTVNVKDDAVVEDPNLQNNLLRYDELQSYAQSLEQFQSSQVSLSVGQSFTYKGSPAIYYLSSHGKELYTSMAVLNAWHIDLANIVELSLSQQYDDSPGNIVSLPVHTAVQESGKSTIYEVVGAYQLKPFARMQDFTAAGHTIKDVLILQSAELFPYYQVVK